MKKLQMLAVLILSVLFVLSCVSDEDEDSWWDETDTYSGGNSGGDADTLPEGSTDTGSSDTSDSSGDPADTDTTDTTPVDDNDQVEPSDDHETPMPDNDPEPVYDNDQETPVSDDDVQPAVDDDNGSVDDGDNTPPSGELPECSPTSGTPCIDTSREPNLVWSTKSQSAMKWEAIEDYCAKWSENGYEWRIPTISELRTLIQGCAVTQTSGSCKITDGCPEYSCRENCTNGCSGSGSFSKLGDTDTLWSGSVVSDYQDFAWEVRFKTAVINYGVKASSLNPVRCVKK